MKALNRAALDFPLTLVIRAALLVMLTPPGTSATTNSVAVLTHHNDLGGLSLATNDTNAIQVIQVTQLTPPNNIHGTPVYWQGPHQGFNYVWGSRTTFISTTKGPALECSSAFRSSIRERG